MPALYTGGTSGEHSGLNPGAGPPVGGPRRQPKPPLARGPYARGVRRGCQIGPSSPRPSSPDPSPLPHRGEEGENPRRGSWGGRFPLPVREGEGTGEGQG